MASALEGGSQSSSGIGRKRSGAPVELRRGALREEQADFPGEIVGTLEPVVDAREPEVGDVVELAQVIEHGDADLFGRDLASGREEKPFDVARECIDRGISHRPVLARGSHPGGDLVSAKRLVLTGTLHHNKPGARTALEGREAVSTAQALAPSPDRGPLGNLPGVDDAVLEVGTAWAAHSQRLIPMLRASRAIRTTSPGPLRADGVAPPA